MVNEVYEKAPSSSGNAAIGIEAIAAGANAVSAADAVAAKEVAAHASSAIGNEENETVADAMAAGGAKLWSSFSFSMQSAKPGHAEDHPENVSAQPPAVRS